MRGRSVATGSVAVKTVTGCRWTAVTADSSITLDNTIHSQIDVEDRLRLVFLGLLPSIKDEKRVNPAEPISARSRDLLIVE